MITPQELLSIGFNHNIHDNSYRKSVSKKIHIEVEEGTVFIVMTEVGQGEVIWEELPKIDSIEKMKLFLELI